MLKAFLFEPFLWPFPPPLQGDLSPPELFSHVVRFCFYSFPGRGNGDLMKPNAVLRNFEPPNESHASNINSRNGYARLPLVFCSSLPMKSNPKFNHPRLGCRKTACSALHLAFTADGGQCCAGHFRGRSDRHIAIQVTETGVVAGSTIDAGHPAARLRNHP